MGRVPAEARLLLGLLYMSKRSFDEARKRFESVAPEVRDLRGCVEMNGAVPECAPVAGCVPVYERECVNG